MGTRARVNVYDGNKILVSIYRQYDGYPEGLGQEVADFVSKLKVVNGYSGKDAPEANGMGCLAAQLIKHLKEGVGNVYIRDTGPQSQGEEYIYNLSARGDQVWITAYEGGMTAFGMPGDSEAEMKMIFTGFARHFSPEAVEA